jgi:protein-tyrosine-phosphatase
MDIEVSASVLRRARLHAALSDPIRLTVVDELAASDRTPSELAAATGVAASLLAHHLRILEGAGVVTRRRSNGDGRRWYLRLRPEPFPETRATRIRASTVLFVCTHNSARSQLAAALWNRSSGARAESAGTHPATRIHPGAIRAGRRLGLDLRRARPRGLEQIASAPDILVTVCDQAREELGERVSIHWSVPDPVERGSDPAFRAVAEELRGRVERLAASVDRG